MYLPVVYLSLVLKLFPASFCFHVFQEYRSEKSLEELSKLVPPECHWYVIVCPSSPKLRPIKFNLK